MILTKGYQNKTGTIPLRTKTWMIMKFTIVLLSFFTLQSQAGSHPGTLLPPVTINGTVVNSKGEPLQNVSVLIAGTNIGTITNTAGHFTLTASNNRNIVLEISSVGFQTKTVKVGNETEILITLTEDVTGLADVVVVGYGTQRKSDLTGAISSVSSKDFAEQHVTRLDQALQGRATGVQVTNVDGAPGSDVRIRIRGANSVLGSNDPLYVIDGYVGADFNMVNPNDIQSIEILKDASSTAIYGSRGSNGVVIITTKKGVRGTTKIDYQGSVGASEVIGKYDLLPAGIFAQTVNERNAAVGLGAIFTEKEIDSFKRNGGTDWQDEIYRTALNQNHQLSISGGSEKSTFRVSASYLNQEGVIKNSGFNRYTLRSDMTTRVNDKLSFRLNFSGARSVNKNTQLQSGTANPVTQALVWAPTTPAYDADGNYTMHDPVGSLFNNPLALLFDRENRVDRTYGNIVAGVNYELLTGLSLDVQYNIDYLNQQNKGFNGNLVTNFLPNASRASGEQFTLQNTNALNYKHTFNEVHKIDAVAVFETQQFSGSYFNANATGLKFPDLKYNNLSQAASFSTGSSITKWTLLSLLGRINYSFKDKYLVTASVRRDGSSKFHTQQYSTFPAVAIGWNLGREDFIQKMDVFSNLKIRASWGLTGSQAIAPYATLSTYNNIITAFNSSNLTSGIVLGNPGNINLKWETTEQKNIGIDIGLFNGRLSASFDYFNKDTRDLLLNRPLPAYAGGGVIASNIGKINNKGWELSLEGTIISSNNVNWTSNFNISNVKNKVVSLGGIADKIFPSSNTGGGYSQQPEFVMQPGKSFASYWGLEYLGTWKPNEASEAAKFNNVPGDSKYRDVNGDGVINTDDYKIIGNGMPATSLGWNNTITYKSFTFNFFFQGVLDVDKMNYSNAAAIAGAADGRAITLAKILDRYIPGVNETSNIPAFSNSNITYLQSSRFLEDGSFVRLKSVGLSYNLPVTMFKNVGNIKVFIAGTNLWTLTDYSGIDPESSNVGTASDTNQSFDYGSYPNSKTYTFGINVEF